MEESPFAPIKPPKKPERAKRSNEDDDDEEEEGLLSRIFSKPEKPDKKEEIKQPKSEVEPISEVEAPSDGTFSPQEKVQATQEVAEAINAQIPENTPEDVAAKYLLDEIERTEGDIDQAESNTLAMLEEAAPEVGELAEPEEEPSQEPQELPEEEIIFDKSVEANDDEDVTSTPAATTHPPGSPPPPPPPPTTTGGPAVPPPGPGRRPPAPAVFPNAAVGERYSHGNPAIAALVGGIVGHYIDRRRGRIKTEKKLLPVQKKLEKQVEDLHWQIKRKEVAIRKVAAETVRRTGPVVIETLVAARAAKRQEAAEKPAPLRPLMPERPSVERQLAPEASQLHGAVKAHEHIGHMLINAESKPKATQQPETAKEPAEELPERLRERHIETLNRSELLRVSEKIIIDGSSLRQIYETHLIGERGLRRLVAEYLHGGEVKKVLRREIVEHEIDFERDPAVRDVKVPTALTSSNARPVDSSSKAALNKLVEQASAGFGDSNAQAYYKARTAYEAREQRQQSNKRRLVDVGLVTTIVILLLLVAALYFVHR